MDILTLILRVVHIFAGVFWVGAAWIGAIYLEPTVRALGPEGGKFMGHLVGTRKYSIAIMIAAVLTLLAGFALFFMLYGGAGMRTNAGMTFGIGGVIGLIAGAAGGMVGAASARLTRLGATIAQQGKPPSPEQQTELRGLQGRLRTFGLATAILTSIALFAMAIARHL